MQETGVLTSTLKEKKEFQEYMKDDSISIEDKSTKLKSITLNKRELCDYELIQNGGFHPLSGFMTKADYNNTIHHMRLSNGKLWCMPIVLSINEAQRDSLQHQDYVCLRDETGIPLAIMDISHSDSIYKISLKDECKHVYGTNDTNHPYVNIMYKKYEDGYIYNIGGEFVHSKPPLHYDFKDVRFTPEQTKSYFKQQGWSKIVGFQTRNPMHRSHYELTKYALRVAGSESHVMLHPVIGITQTCDIDYHTRVKCYKHLLNYYEKDEAMLNLLPLSMRMAGPREAVWHAQIRKNYGCTHFVVGRDHAGPSYKTKEGEDFYGPYDAQNLLMKYADEIGIIPIISKMIVYALPKRESNIMRGKYLPIDEVDEKKYKVMKISGTQQREMLRKGEPIPKWFTFPLVSKELEDKYKTASNGFTLYFVGLSGSGKSTISNYLISKLKEMTNKAITYLDGDIVRLHLSKGLSFTDEDKSINVRRIGYVSSEVTKHGGIAIASNIAPFEKDREFNRELISAHGKYVEIYMKVSVDTCEKRDVKGLYKLARENVLTGFSGVNSRFDEPEHADIVLDETMDIEECIDVIINFLKVNNLI